MYGILFLIIPTIFIYFRHELLHVKNMVLHTLPNISPQVFLESIKTFISSFLSRPSSSIKKVGKHDYELNYTISGKNYTMIIKPKRGPSHIVQVTDHNQHDITHVIFRYLGPEYNWHGCTHITPNSLNYQSVTIEFDNGNITNFSGNEILK